MKKPFNAADIAADIFFALWCLIGFVLYKLGAYDAPTLLVWLVLQLGLHIGRQCRARP
jgi:hypothetical protein